MIIFDSLEDFGTFSEVLRDKRTNYNEDLFLEIRKQDNLQIIYFALNNESTSPDYSTFTIPTSLLEEGQYIARIFEGVAGESDTCYLGSPSAIVLGTWFDCDPLTLDAIIIMDENVTISDLAEVNTEIYSTILRVDGVTYNPVYRNDTPTQVTYNN